VEAAMEFTAALTGNEFDLDCALASTLRPWRGRRNRNFLDGVQSRADITEEAIRSFVGIILSVQSINGDIESALRQTVDDGSARPSSRVRARQKDHKVENIASLERKVSDLFDLQRG